MSSELPSEIRVRELIDGVRYVLPRRPLAGLDRQWAGCMPIGFGILLLGMAIACLVTSLQKAWTGSVTWQVVVFALYMVPFIIVGCTPVALGVFALAGHSRIEIRRGNLRVIEHLGPLRWCRKRKAASTLRVFVTDSGVQGSGSGLFESLGAIRFEFESARAIRAARCYPRDWLQPLAMDITARLNEAPLAHVIVTADVDVELLEEGVVETTAPRRRVRAAKPQGSRVQLEYAKDGLTMALPPAGVWRGSRGLFLLGLLWCGFMAVFSGLTVIGPISSGRASGAIWILAAFSLLFWALGIGMLLTAVNMGRQRAVIDVAGDSLLLTLRNIFGVKQHQWAHTDLSNIDVGPSGMDTGRPVLHLRIHPKSGKRLGLFAGRNEDELRWIASELRDALSLNEESADSDGN